MAISFLRNTFNAFGVRQRNRHLLHQQRIDPKQYIAKALFANVRHISFYDVPEFSMTVHGQERKNFSTNIECQMLQNMYTNKNNRTFFFKRSKYVKNFIHKKMN